MSGFHRQGQPNVRMSDVTVKAPLIAFIAEEEIAATFRRLDPFLIDGACPMNGGAFHQPIRSCDEIVCAHCATVFWR